eukprot:XP_015150287.1 uncharacterized protein LOC101747516 isoform X5 [Gallus gallus]
MVRRPVFHLDISAQWLQDFWSPTEIIPDDVKMEPLNYRQLLQATAILLHVVQSCMQETILLYCLLLSNKRIWLKHPAGFSPETTAHGIQVFPRELTARGEEFGRRVLLWHRQEGKGLPCSA